MFTLFLILGLASAQAQTSEDVTNYRPAKMIFLKNCADCHGDFATVPSYRFLKNTSFFFDLPHDGNNQKMPPRMTGIRITQEEAIVLKLWLQNGAPDSEGTPTLTAEQVDKIFN